MKKLFALMLPLTSFFCFGQTRTDSTQKKAGAPVLVVTPFFETQAYVPSHSNTFDMVYKFSAGAIAQIPITKKISTMVGVRMWQNAAEKYGLSSRSWVQSGFHGAIALLWNEKINSSTISFGPAIVKFSYILSGIPAWHDNVEFQKLSKVVTDSVSGIRGNYYNAPYLFARWQKRKKESSIEIELNLLLPGKWPRPISSWQPRGSLVHAIRTKGVYEKKKFSFKGDLQIPTVAGDRVASYSNLRVQDFTCKVEAGYVMSMIGGKVKIVGGYERDWHALNYPLLLQKSDFKGGRGTWGGLYIGFRVESTILKFKK